MFGFSVAGTTVSWIGGSGDWNTAANWSTGALPGADDDVVIDRPGEITITHSTGEHSIKSLLSQEAFVFSGGTLAVSTTVRVNNTFTLSGGTLKQATVLAGASGEKLVCNNGTLDGVTVNGDMEVGASSNSSVIVVNGLGLNGTLYLGNQTSSSSYGYLDFRGTQSLSGSGTVVFGPHPCNALLVTIADTTLTIGVGITVRGHSGRIGYNPSCVGGPPNVGVINQGTISADVAGGTITLHVPMIGPGNLGTLRRLGGAIAIIGTIDNTGMNLLLDDTTGSWILNSTTTIKGGTITTSGAARLIGLGGTLDGVTVNGDIDVGVSSGNGTLIVVNGLGLNGTLYLGDQIGVSSYGYLDFRGTQSLSGSGTVVFGHYHCNALRVANADTTLTLGVGITVRGHSGKIGYENGCIGGPQNVSVVNQGTISADVAGGTITLNVPTIGPGNLGTLRRLGGAILIVGTIDNTGMNLLLDDTTGSWILNSTTTIKGGTITTSGAARLIGLGGTLDGVTVNGDIDVGVSSGNGTLIVVNGLGLNGTLYLGDQTGVSSYGYLDFRGTQSLSGNGTVVFGHYHCNALRVANADTTLTLGVGITVRGHSGKIGYENGCIGGPQNVSVVNQGTISADVAGGTITLNVPMIGPGNLGTLRRLGGAILIVGTIDNTGMNLLLDDTTGSWILNSTTTIKGGTITTSGAARLIGLGGTLDGVTVNGDIDVGVSSGNGTLIVVNGLGLNGTLYLGDQTGVSSYGYLDFRGTQSLSGNGTVVFGRHACNALRVVNAETTLTLGVEITVRGHSGVIGYDTSCAGGAQNVSVINHGTISADIAGGTITLNAQPFANGGTVQGSGGAINLAGSTIESPIKLARRGVGSVIINPNQTSYLFGQQVTLTAIPGRHYAFSQWADGAITESRTIAIGLENHYTAIFAPTEPLEEIAIKKWDKVFGGEDFDSLFAGSVTADDGYILGGNSWSPEGGNKSEPNEDANDYWVVRLDGQGNELWQRTYGGTDRDELYSVEPTADGGFILGGWSYSPADGNKSSPPYGNADYWLVRIDAEGVELWEKSFGGTGDDFLYSAQPTADGGYILAGHSQSGANGNKSSLGNGGWDYWLIRVDDQGNELWERSFGGIGDDLLYSVQPTADGGFLLGGTSGSAEGVNKTSPDYGDNDFWLIRVNAQGEKLWERSYGGANNDELYSLIATPDGGCLLAGSSSSEASEEIGNKTSPNYGGPDYWVVRVDAQGQILWEHSFGGALDDYLYSVNSTADGGYLLGGRSDSGVGDGKSSPGYDGVDENDYWLVRLDADGNKRWDRTVGSSGYDELRAVDQDAAGNLLLFGSSGGEVSHDKSVPPFGYSDYWLVKLAVREAPVGAPLITINDRYEPAEFTFLATDVIDVRMTTSFPNGVVYYTLDGSDPLIAGSEYTGPFTIVQTTPIKTAAFTEDFGQYTVADPLLITVLPVYSFAATTPGGGAVSIDPASGPFYEGLEVTVTATPAPGWTFMNWQGDASGSTNPLVLTLHGNKNIEAIFGTTLTTNIPAAQTGFGTIQLDPIQSIYSFGSQVRLSAVPVSGKFFSAWNGALSGNVSPQTLTINTGNPAVEAQFGTLPPSRFALTVLISGNGAVSKDPQSLNYSSGTVVTLRATPDEEYAFVGWRNEADGNSLGSQIPFPVTMNQNRTIRAVFLPTNQAQPTVQALVKPLADAALTQTIKATYFVDMNPTVTPSIQIAGLTRSYTVVGGTWSGNNREYTASVTLADDNETAVATVTVSGGNDVNGVTPVTSASETFLVDTRNPSATLTVSDSLITDADMGGAPFAVTIHYSESMNAAALPNVVFTPNAGATLTNGTGAWSQTTLPDDTYTVTFTVADGNETIADIEVGDSGAVDTVGNLQTPAVVADALAIDTRNPTATISVSTDPVTDLDRQQDIAVVFSEAMNPAVAPSIAITGLAANPSVPTNGVWSNGDTTYDVTVEIPDSDESATATVTVQGAKDANGNIQMQATRTFEVKTDCPIDVGIEQVIVDNTDPGYTEIAGVWQDVPGAGYNILGARRSVDAGASMTWSPILERSGLYRVSFYRVPFPDNTVGARFSVVQRQTILDFRDVGLQGTAVDAPRWQALGVFWFDCDGDASVTMTNPSGVGALLADAMRFQWLPATVDPFAFVFIAPDDGQPDVAQTDDFEFRWYISSNAAIFDFDLFVTTRTESSLRATYGGTLASLDGDSQQTRRLNVSIGALSSDPEDHGRAYLHAQDLPVDPAGDPDGASGISDWLPLARIRNGAHAGKLFFADHRLRVVNKKSATVTINSPIDEVSSIAFGQSLVIDAIVKDGQANIHGAATKIYLHDPSGVRREIATQFTNHGNIHLSTAGYGNSRAGDWQVEVQLTNNVLYFDLSEFSRFALSQAVSAIDLFDLGSPHLRNQPLTIAGRVRLINGNPARAALNGLPLSLTITANPPVGSGGTPQSFATGIAADGSFVSLQIPGSVLSVEGDWKIVAATVGNENITGSQSQEYTIPVRGKRGYAILVHGAVPKPAGADPEGLADHRRTVAYVKEVMRANGNGFTDDAANANSLSDDIYEIYADETNALSPKQRLQTAIQIWASQKMLASPAPLYIVLVNHGEPDRFHVTPTAGSLAEAERTLTASDLNTMLTGLEQSLAGNALASQEKIVLVLGMCFSGSFMDEIASPKRVVISAAAANERSIRGPGDETDRQGEYFVYLLFRELSKGRSLLDAFIAGRDAIRNVSRQFSLVDNALTNQFPGESGQHALLDDDGLEPKGSFKAPLAGGDGAVAAGLFLVVKSNDLSDIPIEISRVSPSLFLPPTPLTAPRLFAEVNENPGAAVPRVHSMFMDVKTPAAAGKQGSSSMQASLELVTQPLTQDQSAVTDRFHYLWTGAEPQTNATLFNGAGSYELFYYAVQNIQISTNPVAYGPGPTSQPKVMRVYRANGAVPPGGFDLTNPADGATVDFVVDSGENEFFAWTASSSSAGDVQYIIRFWAELDPPALPRETVDAENRRSNLAFVFERGPSAQRHFVLTPDLVDSQTYWWDVVAVDGHGNATVSGSLRSVTILKTNFLDGWFSGVIRNKSSRAEIDCSDVTLDFGANVVTSICSEGTAVYSVFFKLNDARSLRIEVDGTGFSVFERVVTGLHSGANPDFDIELTTATTVLTIDIDGNGQLEPLRDGLMILRYLFGFRGNELIDGACDASGSRGCNAVAILGHLEGLRSAQALDVDDNEEFDALTDGLLILRYAVGLTGDDLIRGAVGAGAQRTTATAIIDQLNARR